MFASVLLAIAMILSVYYYLIRNYNYWRIRKVCGPEPRLLFGNTKDVTLLKKTMGESLQGIYKMYEGLPYVGIYELRTPALLLRDPEIIKLILVRDFNYFQVLNVSFTIRMYKEIFRSDIDRDITIEASKDGHKIIWTVIMTDKPPGIYLYFTSRGIVMNENADPLCANLINLSGPRWRILRTKLSPAFTAGKIRQMFTIIDESSKKYKEFVKKFADNEEIVEFRDLAAKFTTEVIATCCFGLETNSIQDEDSEFRAMCRKVLDPSLVISLKRIARSYLPGIFKFFRMSLTPSEVSQYFMSVVRDMVKYREVNNYVRRDMMQLLMQLKNGGKVHEDEETETHDELLDNGCECLSQKAPDVVIDDNVIAAQAYIFFLAGFETSSTTMSFAMYELASNPEIQEKLYNEIVTTLRKHRSVSYEAISEMEFLDRVIRETLRKHPPVGMVPRLCNKNYAIPGTDVIIEEGVKVLIPIHAIHHDPRYYPEPWKFDPERFLDENKKLRGSCTFLPFGEGPRICIGTKFAYTQTKAGLVSLLSDYKVELSPKIHAPLEYDQTANILTSKSGIWLKISNRRKI